MTRFAWSWQSDTCLWALACIGTQQACERALAKPGVVGIVNGVAGEKVGDIATAITFGVSRLVLAALESGDVWRVGPDNRLGQAIAESLIRVRYSTDSAWRVVWADDRQSVRLERVQS